MAKTNHNAAAMWTQQSVNNAQNGRYHIGTFIPHLNTAGMTAWRDGVVCTTQSTGSGVIPGDLMVKAVTPTPSLSLTVEAGHCVITKASQGPFLGYVGPSQATITLAAASSVNPRVDRIVARIYDTTTGDSVAGLVPSLSAPGALVIEVVEGTPAGSPVPLSTPAGAISLATVAVATNATQITNANITDTRKSCFTPSGARFLLPGDALSDPGGTTGELRYSTDSAKTGVAAWNGTEWQRLTQKVIAQPSQTAFGTLTLNSNVVLATMSIPDIGGPYWLRVSGACQWFFSTAAGTGAMGLQIRVDANVWDDTTWLAKGANPENNLPQNIGAQATAPVRTGASTFTGSHTLYLIAKTQSASSTPTITTDGFAFECAQIPAW